MKILIRTAIILFSISTFQVFGQCDIEAFASEINVICGEEVNLSAQGEGIAVFENDFDDSKV